MLLACLAANIVTVLLIYIVWAAQRGHSVPLAITNAGLSAVGLLGLAVKIYFIAMAAFVSLMFAKWLLVG